MPWKVSPVSEIRLALVHTVRSLHRPVAAAAREFGVSRKTAHKWLAVHDADPAGPLLDRSRRPVSRSPQQTEPALEQHVLAVRDRFNWGPRKIRAYLIDSAGLPMPSIRTVAAILSRNGRIDASSRPLDPPPVQRFERPAPNDLWQIDHKGPVEVDRRRMLPLTVIDDHSRYCLAFEPLTDKTMARAWNLLWNLFGDVGLPDAILTDNAFNTMGTHRPVGLSWFDAQLVRLGIRPLHGRPYHPQTQGKVERLHRSAQHELLDFNARRDTEAHFIEDAHAWRHIYNHLRPHEALDDRPPVSRWRPSPRRRPDRLPDPAEFYPPGSILRRVSHSGTISYHSRSLLVGRGLCGQMIRIEDHDAQIRLFYCHHELRRLSTEQLQPGKNI